MVVALDGFSCFTALTSFDLCVIDLNGRLAVCSVFVIPAICASMKCVCTWHEMFHSVWS